MSFLEGLRAFFGRRPEAPPPDSAGAADLPAGSPHYRAFVGPPERYDLVAALQFNLLTALGLRESHSLLDIGCGSLRGGKLFIPYLLPGRYFGIEPEGWLVEEGIRHELGRDVLRAKRPTFSRDRDFTLTAFGLTFDFLLAQSIFSHAARPQIERCLSQARQVMGPESLFAATYVPGDEDYTGAEWVYPKNVRYRAETLERLAREAGLVMRPLSWPHPKQKWVLFHLPGAEARVAELRAPEL